MRRIAFFEFWNLNPHLETSLELAKRHLDDGDEVHYHFCGHDALFRDRLVRQPETTLERCLPEVRGAALLGGDGFHFHPRVRMPEVDADVPERFESLSQLMDFRVGDCEVGLSVASSLIFMTRNSDPDLVRHEALIRRMIRSGVASYEFVRARLQSLEPDLVYVFNGRFCNSRSVMNAAQSLDVPFRIHERGSEKTRFSCRAFMPHDRARIQDEMLGAWREAGESEDARRIAQGFFEGRRAGQEQAWKSYSGAQERGRIPDLAEDRRRITYFSSSDDETRAVGDIVKWDRWPDQRSALASLVRVMERHPEAQLVVRLHPHLARKAPEDRRMWMDIELPEGGVLVPPEDKVDTYSLLEASDVVVTGGSTVGIEAVYWRKPSICLGPTWYDRLDAVYLPEGESDLEQLLFDDSLVADRDKALPYGYYQATYGEPFLYYQARSLFEGSFLGVDLQSQTTVSRILGRLKGVAHGRLRRQRIPLFA
jgi:hypothetical protein